jgi:hypothetical protein
MAVTEQSTGKIGEEKESLYFKGRRAQAVAAISSVSFSQGFIHPKVLRGRPFIFRSISQRSVRLYVLRSVPLGSQGFPFPGGLRPALTALFDSRLPEGLQWRAHRSKISPSSGQDKMPKEPSALLDKLLSFIDDTCPEAVSYLLKSDTAGGAMFFSGSESISRSLARDDGSIGNPGWQSNPSAPLSWTQRSRHGRSHATTRRINVAHAFVGQDSNGRRRYASKTFHGSKKQASTALGVAALTEPRG